jgi:hypothetical protein
MDDIVSTLVQLPLYLDAAMLLVSTWAVVLWAAQAGAPLNQWLALTVKAATIVGHPEALREIFSLRAAQGAVRTDDMRLVALVNHASKQGMWFSGACNGILKLFKWAAFIGAALGGVLFHSAQGALLMIALLCAMSFAQEFGRPVAFGLRRAVEPLLRTLPGVLYAPLSFIIDLPIFILAAIGGWVVMPLVWGAYLASAYRVFAHLNQTR